MDNADTNTKVRMHKHRQTSCRRASAPICPRLSPPSVGTEALRATELTTAAPAEGNEAVGSHGEYFPTLTAAAA